MSGIYLGSTNYCTVIGNKAYCVCSRCGRNSEDNQELGWKFVPTRRAFASYKNHDFAKLLIGEKTFDSICNECFTEEDQRKLNQLDNDFELRNQSLATKANEK